MEYIRPETSTNETLDGQEMVASPEAEAVMEEFRGKRVGILNKIMSDRAAKATETIGLMIPGMDIAALAASAIHGETLAGKELDNKSRFNHAAMAGFLMLSYVLLASGNHKEALAAKGASATFAAMEFGPDSIKFIKESVEAAKKKSLRWQILWKILAIFYWEIPN